MKITTADLSSLFYRAKEYFLAKENDTIDYIRIKDDGEIEGVVYARSRDYDEDVYYCTVENLSDDFEELAKARLIEEARQAKIEQEKRKERELLQARHDKENRRLQYLKLKKEFEV